MRAGRVGVAANGSSLRAPLHAAWWRAAQLIAVCGFGLHARARRRNRSAPSHRAGGGGRGRGAAGRRDSLSPSDPKLPVTVGCPPKTRAPAPASGAGARIDVEAGDQEPATAL